MNIPQRFTRGALFLVMGLGVAGCAVPPEEDPVLIKLDELDSRVASIERVVRNESLLRIANELAVLRDEVRELRGQTEALQYEAESGVTRQRDQYLDLDQRLQSLERRTRSGDTAPGLAPVGETVPSTGTLPSTAEPVQSSYQASLELLRQGRYEQAEAGFRQFLIDSPDSELADNARYWLAETHYVNREFETALETFRLMLEQYPDSRKAPDALLKAGFCEYELERWADARATLTAVVERYPESTAARLATQRLERMGAERR
ncbi:tol-pal system protein YbgF [Wenzhouxiangella sp. XN24]|uniref:tol-pal system protein YbgF n=1 Tax=Wenzhouxiangella sp. XN24 TaxID=2713569 RepID=UPI0013EB4259|nr:tol-pal system protein YbgF [Wenzhouxiangella sp. XN24]NGX16646.1 tol-pal system protein YbgF [Wenzhouxiangella sp. XN24]